jgi:Tol biopolymer transport system component
MGEVWLARDVRLGREVAIKVLPPELSADPERLRRFEKEARAASSLNHPGIVTIYDIGTADSGAYIAMERVEGKTLRELLAAGPLPARRLLRIATQIAEGLARAHSSAIVHRDLKPENVMATPEGRVKILDFGLAKLVPTEAGAADETSAPTLSVETRAGVLVGTVGYMSPEQASGKPLDHRSDQFSLGAMLYEAATGRRPFRKETALETLASIVRDEPEPIASAAPGVPAPLRWIIERCLEKEPESRYASTQDLAGDLRMLEARLPELGAGASEQPIGAAAGRRTRLFAGAAIGAAGALIVGVLAGMLLARRPPATFRRITFRQGRVASARFAGDGHTIVYAASWGDDRPQIFTTRREGPESRSLDLPGAVLFSVSPDGEMLVRLGNGSLARVSLAGGAPREILESVGDAAWGPDGKQIAVIRRAGARSRLEYPVGRVLYETADEIDGLRVSPRGDRVSFVHHPVREDNRGYVAMTDASGRERRLSRDFEAIEGSAWSSGGNEIWFSATPAGGRMAIYAVDLSRRERVVARPPGDQELQDISQDGQALLTHWHGRRTILARGPGDLRDRDLSWFEWPALADLSEDGTTVLFTEQGEEAGSLSNATYIRKMDGSPAVRLGDGMACALSPDGRFAMVAVHEPAPPQLALLPTAAGEQRLLTKDAWSHAIGAWFPDGKAFLFGGSEPGKGPRLWVQSVAGGAPRPISPEITRTYWVPHPISPDGKFVLGFDGQRSVVYGADGSGAKPLAGALESERPVRWSADGRLAYVRDPKQAPARLVRIDPATGKREPWKELPISQPSRQLLVTADGNSYVYVRQTSFSDLYLAGGLR